MDKSEAASPVQTADSGTIRKYVALLQLITSQQNRLTWVEVAFMALDILLLMATVMYISFKPINPSSSIEITFTILLLAVGEALSAYWLTFAMRLQLRLKLHYFQARQFERSMGRVSEDIFIGEALFNKDHLMLKSADGLETIEYPSKGFLKMDGFASSAKPRHLSWFMPALFSAIYLFIFVWGIVKYAGSF